MNPFHVVRHTGDALVKCRRRVRLATHGHRRFKDDPLYKSCRTLHTGAGLLPDRQIDQLNTLFAEDVLAYFERPGTSNGPTEALKCRRRHLSASVGS